MKSSLGTTFTFQYLSHKHCSTQAAGKALLAGLTSKKSKRAKAKAKASAEAKDAEDKS